MIDILLLVYVIGVPVTALIVGVIAGYQQDQNPLAEPDHGVMLLITIMWPIVAMWEIGLFLYEMYALIRR